MKAKIILNPFANRWKAKRKLSLIDAACKAAGLEYDLALTAGPGHAKNQAMEAAAGGYQVIVAAGGDGTVSEVVNGLIAAAGNGPTRSLAVMPIGTGNDFNDMARLPRDLTAITRAIVAGKSRQIDAGLVVADGSAHHFDNNCALAMEPVVTIENIRMKKLSGTIRYAVAAFKGFTKLKAWHMRIEWDQGSHEGPIYLLSICNSPRTGGVFWMAPEAKMDDGLFDFVFAPEIPKGLVFLLILRLFRGTHINHPMITYGRTTRLKIVSRPGTPIHADGEVITESAEYITYDILPGKITVITP